MQPFRTVLPVVVALGVACCVPSSAEDQPRAKKPVDVERVLADAAKAETDGRFEEALKQYLKAFTAGRTDPDTRDHIRHCFRHVAQAERHRDPSFQKFVASMPTSDALALYTEAVEKIHKTYADRTRATAERLFAAGLAELTAALDTPAFRAEHLKGVSDAKVAEFRGQLDGWQPKPPASPREAGAAARAVVAAANKTLGLKNGSVVVFELLCGACTGLDEYSTYLPPGGTGEPNAFHELAGYGLLVRATADGLLVDAVLPHSWAATQNKLHKGDTILKVNGRAVAGATAGDLAEALRLVEPGGHRVEFTGAEEGQTTQLPTPLPTVFAAELVEMKAGVGYLRLAAFKDRTPSEFDEAVMGLKARGMKALVIDIRGNSGGLFAAAVGIAKRLLPAGPVAATDGQVPDFATRVFASDSGTSAHDFPVVLLVDIKTMSAAEVLAASLKDNQRATLVGMPTFGKGLIQAGFRLQSLDATADDRGTKSGLLILSVATASGPLSGLIQGRGVTPHVTEADADRQLTLAVDKALELLAGGAVMPPMPMPPDSLPPMPLLMRER